MCSKERPTVDDMDETSTVARFSLLPDKMITGVMLATFASLWALDFLSHRSTVLLGFLSAAFLCLLYHFLIYSKICLVGNTLILPHTNGQGFPSPLWFNKRTVNIQSLTRIIRKCMPR